MKFFITAILLACSTAWGADLNELETLLSQHNPELIRARLAAQAAHAAARGSGALPDPVIGLGYYINEVETRVGPQKARASISQGLPWPGTLGAQEDIAHQKAVASDYNLAILTRRLILKLRRDYYQLWTLRQRRTLLELNAAELKRLQRNLEQRLTTATVSQSSLFEIDIALAKLEDRLRSTSSAATPLEKNIALLLNQQKLTIETPADLTLRRFNIDDTNLTEAIEHNPLLHRSRSLVAAAMAKENLASKKRYPKMNIGLSYIQTDKREDMDPVDNGKDAIVASLGFTLPLWQHKYAEKEKAATQGRHAAEAALALQQQKLHQEWQSAWFNYDDGAQRLQLYKNSIVPRAAKLVSLAEGNYTTGSAISTLIDNYRDLFSYREMVVILTGKLAKDLATLTSLTGLTPAGEPL